MVEFIGLLVSLLFLLLVLLPLITFLRLARLSRVLDGLSQRVTALERQAAAGATPPLAAPLQPAPRADAGPPGPGAEPAAFPSSIPVLEEDERAPRPADVAAAFAAEAGARSAETWVPPVPPPVTPPVAPPVTPPASAPTPPPPPPAGVPTSDLETRIGGRGLLYTGVLVLLLGVSFFLKYAFDNAWVNETGRVTIGALAGVALIAAGLRLAARDLSVFGQALIGTGLAILYLVVYAALGFYELIGTRPAFAGMVLVTLAAATLADRQRAQSLAVIAVGGGFLTPFLVSSGENAQLTLFTYDAMLVVGTLVLAMRHRWLGLNALSYVLTVLTLSAWASRYYAPALWLRTVLFLTLFCVLFLIILRATRRTPGTTARLVTALLATAPVLYHLAAISITAAHPPAIHVYLIAFTAAGLWLTSEPHRPLIRLLVLLGAVAPPLLGAMTLPAGLTWIVPNVVTIVAVAALHTMALLDRIARQQARLQTADLLALHLNGLSLFALLYQTLQPAYPDFRGALAALIALGAIALWQSLQTRDRIASLNAAALAFALAALAVAVQFDGPAAIIGWAAEGAAAVWIGVRAPSVPFQYGGLVLWILALLRLGDGYFDTPANFTAVFNARSLSTAFLVALAYGMAWMFRQEHSEEGRRIRTALQIAASLLSLLWITGEIRSYWDVRAQTPQAALYEQVLLSLGWAAYGAALIVVGLRWRYALARYIGITVIVITVLKVFFYDLWELGGIYRVIGFIAFGVLLVMVSYLYQKRRQDAPPTGAPPSDSPPAAG